MKLSGESLAALVLGSTGFVVGSNAVALEIITEEDLIQGIVVEEQLVRLVDNAEETVIVSIGGRTVILSPMGFEPSN